MARIETYIQDNNITDSDIVIGSDGDDINKTKNYTVGGLREYMQGDFMVSEIDQDNIIKSRNLKPIPTTTNLLAQVANNINVGTPFTVSAKEIYFFKLKAGDFFYVLAFKDLGKGTYGLGNTQITSNNLQIISEKSFTFNNVSEDSTTDTFNLGTITPLSVSEAVNALNPAVTIQPLSDGFTLFTATESGVDNTYLYTGDSGVTGSGQNQTTSDDFTLISEFSSLLPAVATPPASGTFSIDLSNYLGTDYSGSTTNLTSLDTVNETQGGFARVKGNWSSQPTFTGGTEANNSNFESDTDIYLYVEKWADGVVYWYSLD